LKKKELLKNVSDYIAGQELEESPTDSLTSKLCFLLAKVGIVSSIIYVIFFIYALVNIDQNGDLSNISINGYLILTGILLIISLILSGLLHQAGTEENLAKYCLMNSPLQPLMASLIGLIPNCAISVMLTILYMIHTLSFGSLIAGLCSAGGLGVLVLLKRNNDKKDTAIIFGIMVAVSTIIGLLFQYNVFGINKIFSVFGIQV
jgi:hypothetical protein